MKKMVIAIIVIVIVILLIVGAFFVFKFLQPAAPVATTTNPFGQTGLQGGQVPGTAGKTNTIVTRGGDKLAIPDFTGGHPADKEQSGTYYHVTENANRDEMYQDFSIVYGTDSSISVGLLAEPLGAARMHAEATLRKLLQLTDDQICALDVSVMVPASVSDVYAAEDVGLSFCPGAVKLP